MTSRLRFIYSVSFWALLIAGCGNMNCKGAGGGGGTPKTKAYLTIKIVESSTATECPKERVKLVIEPVALTGSEGYDKSIFIEKEIQGQRVPATYDCSYYEVVTVSPYGGLRTGNWKVSVEMGSLRQWATSCTQLLTAGNNSLNFERGKQGCTK